MKKFEKVEKKGSEILILSVIQRGSKESLSIALGIVCKSNSRATTADLDFYRQTTIFHDYNYRLYILFP